MEMAGITALLKLAREQKCWAFWAPGCCHPGKLNDWDCDLFNQIEKGGILFGCGTQDDKGPIVASLFAVKIPLDAGVKFNKRIRFIFCTDEETLWCCIKRYKEKDETPTMAFSPDARFPLICAKNGLLRQRRRVLWASSLTVMTKIYDLFASNNNPSQ